MMNEPITKVNLGPRTPATRAAIGEVTIIASPPGAIQSPVHSSDCPSPYPVSGGNSRT